MMKREEEYLREVKNFFNDFEKRNPIFQIKSLKSELASRSRVDKFTSGELDKSKTTVRNLQDTIDGLKAKLRQYEDGEGRRRSGFVSPSSSSKSDAENRVKILIKKNEYPRSKIFLN